MRIRHYISCGGFLKAREYGLNVQAWMKKHHDVVVNGVGLGTLYNHLLCTFDPCFIP